MKSTKRENKEKEEKMHFDPKTIDHLQKKIEEEREILNRQLQRLDGQLHKEISLRQSLEAKLKNKQIQYSEETQSLKREIQKLQNRIELQQQKEPEDEEEEVNLIKNNKKSVQSNHKLMEEFNDMLNSINIIESEKENISKELNDIKEKNKRYKKDIEILKAQLENTNQITEEFHKKSQQKITQFSEENIKLKQLLEKSEEKNSQNKKKRKEVEKKLNILEDKINEQYKLHKQKEENQNQKLLKINQEKQKLQEAIITKNTKLDIAEVSIKHHLELIEKMKEQNQEKQNQLNIDFEKTKKEFEKIENQYKRLQIEHENLKSNSKKLVDELNRGMEENELEMKRKFAEQMMNLLKDKDHERCQKTLQIYMDGLGMKGSKSQVIFSSNQSENIYQAGNRIQTGNSQANMDFFDKIKMENQLNNFEGQNVSLKKQIEILHFQLNKSRKILEDKKIEIQSKQKQILQLNNRLDKFEAEKSKEMTHIRNENIMLKNKQTQRLQILRDKAEYEEAFSLKISFYERKIKENIQNIQRKDSIIQKLKINRCENDEKIKLYEDNFRKILEENENLKKYKIDCTRKDELMKEYRVKIQKLKVQIDENKNQITSQKKQKNRLEKLVQSKENFITTLKQKFQKQKIQMQNIKPDLTKEHNKIKEIKSQCENKIKKAKKQSDEYYKILCQIREIIMGKVDDFIARSIPKSKKKNHEYEAAKVLGLKSGELQEFLNPGSGMDRQISNELESYWEDGNYGEFISSSLNYLINRQNLTTLPN